MRYPCHHCGKSVSSELPDDSVIRAMLTCPECIQIGKVMFPEDHAKAEAMMQDLLGPEAKLESFVMVGDHAFGVATYPLPKDHWSYEGQETPEHPWSDPGPPPMPFRIGTSDPRRNEIAAQITAAARYAYKASTECGKVEDLSPDALVQNFIVGMIGYWTPDGTSTTDINANPVPVPPTFTREW
jgi:hypothetical protein